MWCGPPNLRCLQGNENVTRLNVRAYVHVYAYTYMCMRAAGQADAGLSGLLFAFPFFFLLNGQTLSLTPPSLQPFHKLLLDHFVLQTAPWLRRFTHSAVAAPLHSLCSGRAALLTTRWPRRFTDYTVAAPLHSLCSDRIPLLTLQWPRRFTRSAVAAPLHSLCHKHVT